jgi:hypothetical protein
MLIIYRTKPSASARTLVETLPNCRRAFNFNRRPVNQGDAIICWGESCEPIEGVRVLNGAPLINKFQAAEKLKSGGIETVEISRTRPQNQSGGFEPRGLFNPGYVNITLTESQARELLQRTQAYLEAPLRALPNIEWLPRTFNHVGGVDLLESPSRPDYWSKKENLVEEYRLHIFKGKSIRAGVKVPRDGYNPHQWIRSLEAGWKINYDGFASNKQMRKLAKEAVEVLGLDFGAVDLGKRIDGSYIVLEVNRAPGISDGTVESYAHSINKWYLDREELTMAA